MKKKIIILIVAIVIVVIGYYVRSLILKKKAEAAMTQQEKFLASMREKFKDINSYDDFAAGIKYAKYPEVFGYDLRLLKRKQADLVTLDELKFMYEMTKIGVGKDNDNDMKFLTIIHKIYP